MRRALLVVVAACAPPAKTPAPPVPPASRADELAWLAGDPARTVAALAPQPAPSVAQLVDLARADAMLGRTADADRALAAAAAASPRGCGTGSLAARRGELCVAILPDLLVAGRDLPGPHHDVGRRVR